MIIVVEGNDLTGKSTFTRLLRERVGAELLNFGVPAPGADPFEEYEHRLYPHLDRDTPMICDRLHWGEKAYGPVLRGRDRLRESGWRHVELFLATHGTVVVYLHQPISVLRERYRELGDDVVDEEHLFPVQVGYEWCLRHTILPVVALRDPGPADAHLVVDLAKHRERVRGFTTYLGPPRPDVLLLGEVRNGDGADRSAFTPRNGSSGHWLLDCLSEGLWPHVGLANACDVDDPRAVWEDRGRPPVVALGGASHLALSTAEVPHAAVPHPQFVRRFHHGRLPEYGRLIEEVAGTTRDELQWRG